MSRKGISSMNRDMLPLTTYPSTGSRMSLMVPSKVVCRVLEKSGGQASL
jgi:hypothetical protein